MYKNNHFLGLNWGMKYLSSFLFALLFLVACTSVDKRPPADVMTKEKMVLVLSDIHLAESVVSTKELPRDTSIYLYRELEKQIFEKHGISASYFKKSYAWYTSHIDQHKDIYAVIIDTLNVRSSLAK